jgi:CDP-6-deoxy-D-xylo-4-hexulose-3-dehydrase
MADRGAADPPRRRLPDPGAVHDEREIEAVVDVLRTTKLLLGERTAELERRVAELLAKRHGVMVNSGSSALRLAIDLLQLEPGDEIITSVLTFSTDIAPMVHSGIVPVFVDVTPNTYQIDADALEAAIGPRTKAILAPNLVGNVPDWDRIRTVADAHGLRVVEDSCDVLDARLHGRRTGERADISVTSFARGHAITAAGGGGLVGVDDDDLLDRCVMLRRWGRRSETYTFGSRRGERARYLPLADGTPYDMVFAFDLAGYNFEPLELASAYGLVQLDKLEHFNAVRQDHWNRIDGFFAEHPEAGEGAKATEGAHTTWMRYPFLLHDGVERTEVQRAFEKRGVAALMVWTGNILRQPGFAEIEHRAPAGGFPNADRVMERAISLPTHHAMTSDDLGYVMEVLADVLL